MQKADGTEKSKFTLLPEYLKKENYNVFVETVNSIFASVSYTLGAQKDEAYFHSLFYLMVSASGADCESEVLTNKGRIDMVIKFSDKIFIIEFKCNQSANAAIKQIHKKGYAAPYKQRGNKIILMGINFDSEKCNISEWKIA